MTRCIELFINDTEPPASGPIEYRCRVCHAEGALSDTMLLPETRTRKIAEEDARRDLYYTAAHPTPRAAVGEDFRVLQVDLQRKLLPTLHHVKLALAAGSDSPEAAAGLRKVLREMITENAEFVYLLEAPELHLVRTRLMTLTEEPTEIHDEDAVKSASTLVRILRAWTEKEFTCRNSIIADFSLVLSGCTRGNAVPYTMGAGIASKAASMYTIST